MFGPEQVTPYSIGYKYYSVVTLMFTIIVTPYWSAITDAYTKGDLNWIKKTIKRLHYIWLAFLALLVGMFFASDYLIELWVGDEVKVTAGLSVALALYTMFFTYNSMFSSFINGVGKLRIEISRLIISTILYIPVTVFFANIYGIKGIMYGLILITVVATILYRIQYSKIILNRATGIWNK
jgi:O-antigen/teichoic acid export membrane protein